MVELLTFLQPVKFVPLAGKPQACRRRASRQFWTIVTIRARDPIIFADLPEKRPDNHNHVRSRGIIFELRLVFGV